MKTTILFPITAVLSGLALAVVVCLFAGCYSSDPSDLARPTAPSESKQIDGGWVHINYTKTTIEGHEYLFFNDTAVIHNENCPCKQK